MSGKRKAEGDADGAAPEDGKKRKASFRYGNYVHYYNYRTEATANALDPRLACLDPAWLRNKKVLDIGCHEGVITCDVARHFGPRWVTGVDIDRSLINKAVKSFTGLRNALRNHVIRLAPVTFRCENYAMRASGVYGGTGPNANNPWVAQPDDGKPSTAGTAGGTAGSQKQKRQQFDKAAMSAPPYGAILLFSVTKWVHLNFGDDGIRQLFARVHEELEPGGVLVLEAQTIDSYRKAFKKVGIGAVCVPLASIQMLPDAFDNYLTTTLGFEALALPSLPAPSSDAAAAPADAPPPPRQMTEFDRRSVRAYRKSHTV